MTEPNEPISQPGQQPPVAPPYPGVQQYPTGPQYPGAQQYPAAPQYPGAQPYPYAPQYPNAAQHPNGAQYPGPQFGQYGYPYGYYAPQQPGTNGMAIASLILGICGFLCVSPLVGLGLGIVALSRIKKTGQSGRGMAIAGIILSSVWIALLVLMLATGNFHLHVGNGSGTGPSVEPTQGPDGTTA